MLQPNSSFLGLKLIELTITDTINAGASNDQTITPPSNQAYRIINMFAYAPDPSGSSSGTHEFEVFIDTMNANNNLFLCRGNTGTDIYMKPDVGLVGDTEEPAGTPYQMDRMTKGIIVFDNSNPLNINYNNDTDANQTANVIIEVLVEVYKVLI